VIAINDLSRHHAPLEAELAAAVARVVKSGRYILGPEVEAFEQAFALWCGARHCVAVGNGTDALELALRAAAVGPGDEVATVANAGMYATTAIHAVGATPAYAEIDARTLLLDAAELAARLASASRVRAIVATHLYGRLADVESLARIARERGIVLIEDCAQAHGAARAGRKAGTFGGIGCFSFYPTKNLGALGDAGALVTDDDALAGRVRQLRTYGWSSKYRCAIRGGINSRMDELQAAVLRVKLPHVESWNRRRRAIARYYTGTIVHPAIALPPGGNEEEDVTHLYVVRTPQRDALRAHLAGEGVAADVHYPVADYRQEAFSAVMADVALERTDDACATVLSLPCYPEMTDAEVETVVSACNRWRAPS
jgi:dTDP-3-amino-2,3,6-trideoxy-4-keto-D-glucose/dTDP-3-amino-3,4,6-trideoxy-alpha-D-glucose/dTDP-2,6-dideoxy-D-kanosamine transaminase